jgi:hypothetical protein
LLVEPSTTPLTIEHCGRLAAGTGIVANAAVSDTRATAGVVIRRLPGPASGTAGETTIVDSSIDGGAVSTGDNGASTHAYSTGLFARGGGASTEARVSVKLERVRVYGGDSADGSASSTSTRSVGVRAELAKVDLTSSLVHGGGLLGKTGYTRAFELVDSALAGVYTTALGGQAVAAGNAVVLSLKGGGNGATGGTADKGRDVVAIFDDSLFVANAANTYGVFAEGQACSNGYLLSGARFAYLHPETSPWTTSPPAIVHEAIGTYTIGCPARTTLGGSDLSVGKSKISLYPAVDLGAKSDTATENTLGGCVDSASCLSVLFPLLTEDGNTPAAVLSPISKAYLPACGGAAIKSSALCKDANVADTVGDLNGLARGNMAQQMLGAQTAPKP